jgi:hypothetical protein
MALDPVVRHPDAAAVGVVAGARFDHLRQAETAPDRTGEPEIIVF